jgi:putative ABC transport system permease protein
MMFRVYMTLEDRPAATIPEIPTVDLSVSTPGYIETMNIRLLRGRTLTASDDSDSPFVAVVNEAFIRRNLPGEDPIGRRLRFSQPDALLPEGEDPRNIPWYTIVGVVGDVKRWDLTSEATPEVFIPQKQHEWARDFYVVVHTALPMEVVADQMRRAVWEIDPEQPVASVQSVAALYSQMVAQPRFNAALVGAFGLTALGLALMGVYGLLANSVTARTREIGVRVAMGARPSQILRHVAGQGVVAAAVGIAIGLVVSAAATRVMKSLLFGIEPIDLPTFLLVLLSVLMVASLAASVPSWRAAKLDPTEALAME